MLWLMLTLSDGYKVRINIHGAEAYYSVKGKEIPKDCPDTNTAIEVGEMAYHVKETAEQIDDAVRNESSPLRVIVVGSGWR